MKQDHRIWRGALVVALALGFSGWATASNGPAAKPKPQAKAQVKAQAKARPAAAKDQGAKAAAKATAKSRKAVTAKSKPAAKSGAAKPGAPVRSARTAGPALAQSPVPAQREPHWTQLPPSRFYPHGIPELRPEFLYPLPGERAQAVAEPPRPVGAQPELLP